MAETLDQDLGEIIPQSQSDKQPTSEMVHPGSRGAEKYLIFHSTCIFKITCFLSYWVEFRIGPLFMVTAVITAAGLFCTTNDSAEKLQ